MNNFNQDMALAALHDSLVPSPCLIDGRSQQDWLAFIADFASLVNFFDATNTVNGNWAPFLLKDPVVLLASISRTNVTKMHSLYLNTCTKIEQAFAVEIDTGMANSFEQLFDQLLRLFARMERWIHFMCQSHSQYGLKRFVIEQVENTYSSLLWALVALHKQLAGNRMIPGLRFEHAYFFSDADPKIWLQHKDRLPYWEILGLHNPLQSNKLPEIFKALKAAGDGLFAFFSTIVAQAKVAFEKLQSQKIDFPDTALIRAFVNLLMVHTEQLNGLSQKHLDFYYSDILNLQARQAKPDHVFITAEPTNKTLPFYLKKGMLFDAGNDAQKKPIVFESVANVSLNPCSIVSAHTLAVESDTPSLLYHRTIGTPAALQKDTDGKILSWPAMGGSYPPLSVVTATGFALSSPLFLLREGQRNLTVTFTFDNQQMLPIMQSARYYLSTRDTWLAVTGKVNNATANQSIIANQVVLEIELDAQQPPIETFAKQPDQLTSDWPLLKVMFDSIPAKDQPPVLQSLEVEVDVTNLATLQLYNDFGALDTKKAFTPFGPTPLVDNSFILGSSEIFSKPLQSLHIGMLWENVPADFQQYYQEYNNYIANLAAAEKHQKKTQHFNRAGKKIQTVGFFKKVGLWIGSGLSAIKTEVMELLGIQPENPSQPFNNGCFTISFGVLQNRQWDAISFEKKDSIIVTDGAITATPYVAGACVAPQATVNSLLFGTNENCVLTTESFFSYEPPSDEQQLARLQAFPELQRAPLEYAAATSHGFLKMKLTGPEMLGFGSALYPEVVAHTAMQNALLLSANPKRKSSSLLSPPKLPFVPKLKGITAHYNASQLYDFAKPATYPLQCFCFSAFAHYLVYQSAYPTAVLNRNPGDRSSGTYTSDAAASAKKGIALFASLNGYKGFMYLELAHVIAPDKINLYVEVARKYGNVSSGNDLDYYYLAQDGWQPLEVVADGTNNLCCPGIVTLDIPADISNQTQLMPGTNFWIAIATKDEVNLFPEIVLIKTNGIELVRSSEYWGNDIPKIPAGVISRVHTPMPQLTAVAQPFPSFGGGAAEEETARNKRVANRLKTKDRLAVNEDFLRLIKQEFQDIYYATVCYEPLTKITRVYVINSYASATEVNAFTPMPNECQEIKVQKYLQERASGFVTIRVSGFTFRYVTINATITLQEGYEINTVQKAVRQALDIFLSPWIADSSAQIAIGRELTDSETVTFIRCVEGVGEVDQLFFNISASGAQPPVSAERFQTVAPSQPGNLIISGMNHVINLAAA